MQAHPAGGAHRGLLLALRPAPGVRPRRAGAERRYRERSRQLHPDRFAKAEPRERRLSLERATRLNDAYRVLKDWRRAPTTCSKLAGQDVFGEGKTFADPEFLEEQLEWREADCPGPRRRRRRGAQGRRGPGPLPPGVAGGRGGDLLRGSALVQRDGPGDRPALLPAPGTTTTSSRTPSAAEAARRPPRRRMARAIGIDLGTTNSLVAFVDPRNRPQVVTVDEGRPLLPSAVHYPPGGAVEVGAAAKRQAPERPVDTILSVKRFMGRGPGDIRAEDRGISRFDESGAVVRLVVAGGQKAVTPIEVSAEILKVLKKRAAEALGGPPGGCVITVPAYFDDAQRQATKDAGRLAGLDVLRLLNEPTAAALAYGLDKQVSGTFAVYDLGGGTFDVSILRLDDGVFEVLATGGDTHLGGDDFDRVVAARLMETGLSPRTDAPSPAVLRGATAAAQRIRETLSTESAVEAEVELPEGHRLSARLTRDELEALILPVVERTTGPCRSALKDSGLPRVDGVVLVGGSTRGSR